MKQRLLSFLLVTTCLLNSLSIVAQTPQSIPYQSVARNTAGNLLSNQNLSIRFTIRQATVNGTILYRETHSVSTNSLGLFTALIGQGTPVTGTLSGISWGSGSKFLQVEMDASGGSTYTDMGTTQMSSVPYALYAETANVPGVAGPAGTNGKTVLNGTVNPTAGNGVDGDFYINTTTKQLFGPKTSGVWGSGTSLIGPTGANGAQGIQGLTGPQGTTGAQGVQGIQGVAGLTGPQGIQGTTGAAGINGKTVLNGTVNPTAGNGVDGDFYINTITKQLFGPKTSGVWGSGTSLIGPTGSTGAQGIQGLTGPQGATGAQGLQGIQGVAGPQGPAGTLSPGTNIGNTTYWNGTQWLLNNNFLFNNGARIGIGTNSPAARLHVADSAVVFTGLGSASTLIPPPIQGAGTRMMWYPQKAAFRVGMLSSDPFDWDKDSIGLASIAMGIDCKASENMSIAMGFDAKATNFVAVALGMEPKASGFASVAIGLQSEAIGDHSVALSGTRAKAIGLRSAAMGNFTQANGITSLATGDNTKANGDISTSMGTNTTANGYASLVIGSYNDPIISTQSSMQSTTPLFIIGNGSSSSQLSNVMVVRNDGSMKVGNFTSVNNASAIAMGEASQANGYISTAMGFSTQANGGNSLAIGRETKANGGNATSMGQSTQANGFASLAIGRFNDSIIATQTSIQATTPLFIIGNGTSDIARSNAMVVQNDGNVGIGTSVPAKHLHVVDAGTSGGTPYSAAGMVLESNTSSYFQLLTPDASDNGILFGTASNSRSGGILYNAAGNKGFQFRTDGNSTKMVIDSNGNAGIGNIAPVSRLETAASFGAAITTTTTNITLSEAHHTVIITGGTPTITLPTAASSNRRMYIIVNGTATARNISSYLGFAGVAVTTIAATSSITLQSNGVSWYRIQ